MLSRILALTCCLAAGAALTAACSPGADSSTASDDLSAVRQAQVATRVFRKFVGRDPTPAEIGQLRDATLAQMVDAVLALPDFEREGFFGFQRDRLLLHRDGDGPWLDNSLKDYCALKLDMQDVARADKSGGGYYEILRYRERWVPLTMNSVSMPPACLTTKVGPLRTAINNPPPFFNGGEFDEEGEDPEPGDDANGAGNNGDAPPTRTEAETCAQYMSWRTQLVADLNALDASFDDEPFIKTPAGRAFLTTLLRESSFTRMSGVGEDGEDGEPNVDLPPAVAAEISLVPAPGDAEGTPQLRMFDGAPSDRCTTADVLAAPTPLVVSESDRLVLYTKVRVPADLEGVHASMYWLSRHPSTVKNRDLHRARMIFFSYMCTEISPAMAAVGGGDPQPIPALEPYFDPADNHVRTSANCYNCHTQVQPVANYFGETTRGASYTDEFTSSSYYGAMGRYSRPGGLWRGDAFHPAGAGMFGMEGLAELLSNLDAGHDCIARNAWTSLVGSGYPLTDDERNAAVAAFKGDETFRFTKLLRHLAVDNPRGKAFFEGGEPALAAVQPGTSADCRDVPSVPEAARSAPELLTNECATCHSGNNTRGFFDRDGDRRIWNPERLVGPGLRYGHAAELYDRLYCKVWSGEMPMGGWDESNGSAQDNKKRALCYLGGKRNEAAHASNDPAVRAFDSKPCDGQVPVPGGQPHPIEPQP